jgi:PAS domain S-box-containing protein
VSAVVPVPETRRSHLDLSDAALPIGPILEAAFREAVTEMALITPEGSFLRANAAMCQLLARTEAELTAMTVVDVTHPDDRGTVRAVLDDARSGVLRGFRIWGRAIGAGGETIPMLVAATMLRGETGEELCFFVQVLDAEASPSAPLPPALEHQPVIDFTCDREGRLVGVSPAVTLFGWNPEELQSVAAFDLVHPADRARAAAVFHTVVLQPGVPVALPTMRFRDHDGAWWPVDAVAINLLDHDPGVIRVSARIVREEGEGRTGVRILDPQPDERASFARELHDGLGQILTSLSLFARSIEGELTGHQRRRLAALRVLADEALATTRSLAWSLRGSTAPPDGLSDSLRALAETIQARTGLSIEIDDRLDTRFTVRVEAAVYKIVEEALTNVMRHASARSVTISLEHGGGTLTVVIADDGDGFEPEHRALTAGSGMGLLCMEERARLLDGTVRIQSAPGQGAVVVATLPVSEGGR